MRLDRQCLLDSRNRLLELTPIKEELRNVLKDQPQVITVGARRGIVGNERCEQILSTAEGVERFIMLGLSGA